MAEDRYDEWLESPWNIPDEVPISIERYVVGRMRHTLYLASKAVGKGVDQRPKVPRQLFLRCMRLIDDIERMAEELEPYYLAQPEVMEQAVSDLVHGTTWDSGRFESPEAEDRFKALRKRHGRG